MRHISSVRAALPFLLAALVAALAGCGTSTPPAASHSPSRPATSAPAPSSPAPSPTATSTAPGDRVVAFRVSYPWHWPNDVASPGSVRHSYQVPPVPQLVAIAAGDHPAAGGERAFNRMSFTFTDAFPTYEFTFTSKLIQDGSGEPVHLAGDGVFRVIFREAQAHTNSGASSIVSQPPAQLGMTRMVAWAPAGDFEGVLTFGVGIHQQIKHANPQYQVRTVELEKVTAQGRHLYVVAFDIES